MDVWVKEAEEEIIFFLLFINDNSVSEYRRMEEQYNKESFESLLLNKWYM